MAEKPTCCQTCPHYGEIEQDDNAFLGCLNEDNPWHGLRRPGSHGVFCPDHPSNAAVLEIVAHA